MNNHAPDLFAPTPERLDQRSRWPVVIGTVSIVWGSLQLCATLFSTVMSALDLGPRPNIPVAKVSPIWQALSTGVSLGSVLLLITAGIALVMRRRAGVTLHLVWASVAMVLWFISVVMAAAVLPALADWARANPQDPLAQQMKSPGVKLFIGVVMTAMMLVSAAWPTFCLVWFGLLKRGRDAGALQPMAYPATDPRR